MTRICSIVLAALLLSGCASVRFHYVVRDYCELHHPGKAHRKDTPGTQAWIDNDREFYKRRCPNGKWR